MAVKRWDGTKWVQQAGSTKPFYQADAPSSPVAGDIWIESDVDVPIYDGTYQTGNRNALINGKFAVDQRNSGASQTFTAGLGGANGVLAYSIDRWYAYCAGANITGQRVAGSAPDQYYYRFTGATSNTAVGFGHRIEAANSYHFAGKSATLSVSLASSSLTTVTWTAYYATTTDTFGTVASPTRTQIATGTFTITSTLTRYSTTISVPSAATTGIEILFTTGALTATNTLTFANAQFELGTSATPFEHRSYGQELALCQRYYWRLNGNASYVYTQFGNGTSTTTTSAGAMIKNPVTMRTIPTSLDLTSTASNYGVGNGTGTVIACSVLPVLGTNNRSADVTTFVLTTAGSLTAGQGISFNANNTAAAYIGVSAEL